MGQADEVHQRLECSPEAMPQSTGKPLALEQRVYGSEHEYGLVYTDLLLPNGMYDVSQGYSRLSRCFPYDLDKNFLPNGGCMYLDRSRPEGCTPPCQNIREYIAYERATERHLLNHIASPESVVYRTSGDFYGSHFGVHQNYLVRQAHAFYPREWNYMREVSETSDSETSDSAQASLVLWGVVEKLLTGSGFITQSGGRFLLSHRLQYYQRSFDYVFRIGLFPSIKPIKEEYSMCHPPPLCYSRLQIASNDVSMCQSATAMKMELTRCVLHLYEEGLLPHFEYTTSAKEALKDARGLCAQTSDWELKYTAPEFRNPLRVHKAFHQCMAGELTGACAGTDEVLAMYGETIQLLRKIKDDPYALKGRLDWVTKKYLLDMYARDVGHEGNYRHPAFLDLSLDYHKIYPEGIFLQSEQDGWIERWIPESDIERAMHEPPQGTSACARIAIERLAQQCDPRFSVAVFQDWSHIHIDVHDPSIPRQIARHTARLNYPFLPYHEEVERVRALLAQVHQERRLVFPYGGKRVV